MRKKVFLSVIVLILAVSVLTLVSASKTVFTVNTYANHDVTLNVINPVKEETIFSSVESSGDKGKAFFDFETSLNKVDISIVVRKNGKIIVFEKLQSQSPSPEMSITALKEEDYPKEEPSTEEEVEEIGSNVTQEETQEVEEIVEEELNAEVSSELINESSDPKVGKASAFLANSPIIKVIFYIIGGVSIILLLAGFVIFFVLRKKVVPKEIKVKKYSEFKKEASEKVDVPEGDQKLLELEGKINNLKEEIEGIKNKKNKIKEAENRLKRDMEELENLKKDSQ